MRNLYGNARVNDIQNNIQMQNARFVQFWNCMCNLYMARPYWYRIDLTRPPKIDPSQFDSNPAAAAATFSLSRRRGWASVTHQTPSPRSRRCICVRGTSPAARKQQRYVAARTRFVGFARRGPICMIARGSRVRSIPYQNTFDAYKHRIYKRRSVFGRGRYTRQKEKVKPNLREKPPLERGGVIARMEDYWLITTG